MPPLKVRAELPGQDWIQAEADSQHWHLSARGCRAFLREVRTLHAQAKNPREWPLPQGTDHVSLLLREFILKCRNEWNPPETEDEICHCRMVSRERIESAILNGAHTPQKVTRQTSASSNCGTCRPEVEKLIRYRLGKPD